MAKVLIVDDNPWMDMWVTLLNELGHSASRAETGEKGLEMLTEDLDVVLLDYNMPGINGYEFSERVRKDTRYKELPLVGIGGFPLGYQRQHLTEMFPAPFMVDEVLNCIKKYERRTTQ